MGDFVACIEESTAGSDFMKDAFGSCSRCAGALVSEAVFTEIIGDRPPRRLVVSKCAGCDVVFVNIYDENWSWLDEKEAVPIGTFVSVPVYGTLVASKEAFDAISPE